MPTLPSRARAKYSMIPIPCQHLVKPAEVKYHESPLGRGGQDIAVAYDEDVVGSRLGNEAVGRQHYPFLEALPYHLDLGEDVDEVVQ